MTVLNKFIILLGVFLLITSCASVRPVPGPDIEIFNIPPLNILSTSEIGNTILSKGKTYAYDGIELFNKVSGGDGLIKVKFTIPPQQLVAKMEDDKWVYYFANNTTGYDKLVGTSHEIAGLKISKNNKSEIAVFGRSLFNTLTPEPHPQYKYSKVLALDQPSFRQELIYNGKVGNSVKFLYREISNNLMRGSFSQEVQYDLADGNTVGFKGARIEIIRATNTQLTYRVLSSFPQYP